MSVNPLSHFLNLSGDEPVIALYQSLNKENNEISDFLVIRTGDYLIELSRIEQPLLVEQRTVFDASGQHVVSYVIFPEKGMLYYQVQGFEDFLDPAHTVTTEEVDGRRVMTVLEDGVLRYTLVLSEGIPNIHHSSVFIPEADALPLQIEEKEFRRTFHAFITDEAQKRAILDSLKLDLDAYTVLDQNDVDQLAQNMFGVSYDEMVSEMRKKME